MTLFDTYDINTHKYKVLLINYWAFYHRNKGQEKIWSCWYYCLYRWPHSKKTLSGRCWCCTAQENSTNHVWLFNCNKVEWGDQLLNHMSRIPRAVLLPGGRPPWWHEWKGRLVPGSPEEGVFSTLFRDVMLDVISDLSLHSLVMRMIANKCGKSPAIGATLQVTL